MTSGHLRNAPTAVNDSAWFRVCSTLRTVKRWSNVLVAGLSSDTTTSSSGLRYSSRYSVSTVNRLAIRFSDLASTGRSTKHVHFRFGRSS